MYAQDHLTDKSSSAAALAPHLAASLLTVALAVAANIGRCLRLWNLSVVGGPSPAASSSLDPTAESSSSPRCAACRGSLDHSPASNASFSGIVYWILDSGRSARHVIVLPSVSSKHTARSFQSGLGVLGALNCSKCLQILLFGLCHTLCLFWRGHCIWRAVYGLAVIASEQPSCVPLASVAILDSLPRLATRVVDLMHSGPQVSSWQWTVCHSRGPQLVCQAVLIRRPGFPPL